MSSIGKFIKRESRLVGMGESGNWGAMTSDYSVSFGDDENVPKLDNVDGCTTLNIQKSPLNCILNRVNFMVWKLSQ